MRRFGIGLAGAVLLLAAPPVTSAYSLHPAGVPLTVYVVILQRGFPTVASPCTPPDCPDHPIFTIGPIDPANCLVPSFATEEDAQAYILQNAPFPGPWYTVEAPDPAHAYAKVLLENVLVNAPNAVPASLVPDAEEQVAEAFSQLCGSPMPA